MTFNMFKAIKFPKEFDECHRIDVVNAYVNGVSMENCSIDPFEDSIVNDAYVEKQESQDYVYFFNAAPRFDRSKVLFEPLERPENGKCQVKPSIKEPPLLELKPLPTHLRYAFLGTCCTLPVIISSSLDAGQGDKLLRVLR